MAIDRAPLPPLQRRRGGPTRGSTYAIRRASGMRLAERVSIQTHRDELAHELAQVDAELVAISARRRELVAQLGDIRERLYSAVPWSHGRRPPDVDTAPLPPAAPTAEPLIGRSLRAACLDILRRHGPTSLRELHGLLHRYGYLVGSRRPVAALSDAMRHEVRAGRARRVERGVYDVCTSPPARPLRTKAWMELPAVDLIARFRSTGRTPLDPEIDDDPSTWGFARAADEPHPSGVPPGTHH